MSEVAASTAVVAEGQIERAVTARSIRETSLHEASLGLVSILTGLALITPLNAFAGDLLDDPLGGNWSARFLVLGLLAQTGFALHFLASEAGGKTLAGSSAERHPTMPGVRWFSGYHAALADMWAGAVLVVFLIILAAAIPRGVTVFSAPISPCWSGRRSCRLSISSVGRVRDRLVRDRLVRDRLVPRPQMFLMT